MTFRLYVDLGNDSMQTPDDIAAALRHVATILEEGRRYGDVRDLNGNTVGRFGFTGDPLRESV